MTNYNESLDKILLSHGAEQGELYYSLKQAITSLIKELVAEAQPEKPQGTIRSSDYWEGYYEAKGVFEQNLLKALEEV